MSEKCHSRTLIKMESKKNGLKSDVAVGLWNVGMGTTDEIFQLDGGQ